MPPVAKIFVIGFAVMLFSYSIITIYCEESNKYNYYKSIKSVPNAVAITFKQFIDFYNLNPDAYYWEIQTYKTQLSYHAHSQIYHLYFKNYLDTIKFVKWVKAGAQRKKMLQNYATQQGFVECVKKDMQIMQEQSAQEIQNGIKEMEKVKWQ